MTSQPPDPDLPPPPGAFNVPLPVDSPTSFSAMPPPPTSPSDNDTEPPPRREGKPRPWVVVFGIAAAIFISLVAISLLYYTWYKAEDYETTIVVWGWPDWEGATVEVAGANLPQGKLTRKLDDPDHVLVRFHVPPGAYAVRVEREGHVIAQRETSQLRPLAERTIWWPFRASPAATQMGVK